MDAWLDLCVDVWWFVGCVDGCVVGLVVVGGCMDGCVGRWVVFGWTYVSVGGRLCEWI